MEKSLLLLKQEKVKSAFIADVTHELRTPLAIIKGNVELALQAKENTKMNKEVYEAINVEVDHLAGILSDLAILTNENSVFSHTMEKTKADVDVSKVMSHVVERLKKVSFKKNITIEMHLVPHTIFPSSKNYLEKLFFNIIGNAIFYGKENGVVTVTVLVKDSHIEVVVQDNGIGIPKDELANIFERFYRIKKAREINPNGTGLGLAISKCIVEAHGGTISISSKVSMGTTVSIVLPLS